MIPIYGTPLGGKSDHRADFMRGRVVLVPWKRAEDLQIAKLAARGIVVDNGGARDGLRDDSDAKRTQASSRVRPVRNGVHSQWQVLQRQMRERGRACFGRVLNETSKGNPMSDLTKPKTARTPSEIARNWYSVDEIERCIQQQRLRLTHPGQEKVPEDIYSREFAEWLTHQYQLAMAKGIQLGRHGSED